MPEVVISVTSVEIDHKPIRMAALVPMAAPQRVGRLWQQANVKATEMRPKAPMRRLAGDQEKPDKRRANAAIRHK